MYYAIFLFVTHYITKRSQCRQFIIYKRFDNSREENGVESTFLIFFNGWNEMDMQGCIVET